VSFNPIRPANSVRGTVASGGSTMVFGYDAARNQLLMPITSQNQGSTRFGDMTIADITDAGLLMPGVS